MPEIYGEIVHFFTLTSRSILMFFNIYYLRMKQNRFYFYYLIFYNITSPTVFVYLHWSFVSH